MKPKDLKYEKIEYINKRKRKIVIAELYVSDNGYHRSPHAQFSLRGCNEEYIGRLRGWESDYNWGINQILEFAPELADIVPVKDCDQFGNPSYPVEDAFFFLQNRKEDKYWNRFFEKYRITEDHPAVKDLCAAADSNNKDVYRFMLEKYELPKYWREQADKAIATLEKLTGEKFVDQSTSSRLDWRYGEGYKYANDHFNEDFDIKNTIRE